MNITDNLIRIKEGKENIIKSLKNKGVSIADNTLINEIPTIIDNAEIGGGGDTPVQPEIPELVQKYEGASVFRINVPSDGYEFAINLCNNASTATYDVDWGDGVLEYGLTTDEQHHTYTKKGIYDVNIYNLSKDIALGGESEVSFDSSNSRNVKIYYLFNNSKNDIWTGYYFENKDYICTNILIGKNILAIQTNAFRNCSSLTSINILEGITSIRGNAFNNCSSLTSITIPESVTSIGSSAFSKCESLTSITIPESVTKIDSYTFQDCSNLTSITIPETVTSIGSSAFNNCSNLTSITIPESVTSIGQYAFQNCRNLTSITIPESVTSIEQYAFYRCSNLTSITIPESVTSIRGDAFNNCSNLTSITIPESVTSIGQYAFQNCRNLTSITIPESVTKIDSYTFQDCSNLTSITIPETVTSIGSSAFNNCSNLTSITIPESVTSIGQYAFQNCRNLTSITIPESVTSIEQYAFNNCYALQFVVIPESVTSIGQYAFQNCYALQFVVIPESVTSIGNNAFNNCNYLNSITCKALTAPTIQSNSFPTSSFRYTKRYLYVPKDSVGYDEGNWKTYLIDKGWELRYIEDRVKTPTTLKLKTKNNFFHNLQAIGQANLIDYELIDDEYIYHFDDKITELLQYTFYNRLLEEIVLPEGVKHINERGFYDCSSLQSIELPSTLTNIGYYVFYYSYKLSTITCKAMTAPKIQNDTFDSVGTKVPSGTKKVLRVPEGSSGYEEETSQWYKQLILRGYTVEYIPLSEL